MIEKNFIIGMSDNEISKKYMEIVIPQIKRVTFNDVILWEGTTPKTLPINGPLKFNKTKPTKGTCESKYLSLTEKSIWYSHYLLWKHISENNYNAWIFEHDIDLSSIDVLISPEHMQLVTAQYTGSMDCYYITPFAAKLLCNYAETEEIYYQVDSFVYVMITSKIQLKNISCKQKLPLNQLNYFGNTIDHQPSFATYSHQE